MPDRRFVYVADDAAFPYGDWEEEALRAPADRRCSASCWTTYRPEIAVIPCNTASTLALGDLRAAYPQRRSSARCRPSSRRPSARAPGWCRSWRRPAPSSAPIRATSSSPSPTHAMCGWSAARTWRAWRRPIFAARCSRMRRCSPKSRPCFVEMDGKRTDIVVLACTHYPFLANIFRRLAPWPVDWLDPAEAIARRAPSCCNVILPADPGQQPDRRHLHLRQARFPDAPADAGFWAHPG